jgi:hypothetical protein
VPRTAWRRTAAVLALAAVPLLSACAIGVNAGTTAQGPSGNGATANSSSGGIGLRGITIVTSAIPAATKATIVGTIVNLTTDQDDVLTGVTVTDPSGATATITGTAAPGGTIALPANRPTSAVRIGFNADYHVDLSGLKIAPSAYAKVVFTFQKAGAVPVAVMSVPPVGIYAGLGPFTN